MVEFCQTTVIATSFWGHEEQKSEEFVRKKDLKPPLEIQHSSNSIPMIFRNRIRNDLNQLLEELTPN